jgi:ribosomal protein S27AE/cytochrome c-type biogenesis protein CcmH/NrfF
MTEVSVVSLRCPRCGANLSIGKTADIFACGYCGASVKVERSGNIIALRLLTDAMSSVQRGTDRTAAELAIRRLSEELKALEREKDDLLDSRRGMIAKWDKRIKAADQSSDKGILFLVGVIVLFITAAVLSPFEKLNERVKWVIAIVAIVVTCLYVWRTIRRGERRLREKEMAARDQELTWQDQKESDVHRRVQVAASKLKEQRLIVDS